MSISFLERPRANNGSGDSTAHNDSTHATSPMTVYEVHPGSWMRAPEENNRPLTVDELASKLGAYVRLLNFTHVEIMLSGPPFVFKNQADLTRLIDGLHDQGIGALLDGVIPPTESGQPSDIRNHFQDFHADGCRAGDVVSLSNGGEALELKWDRQWSQEILYYLGEEPARRKFRHQQMVSRTSPALSDSSFLPLSHDQVTIGKKSLLAKMPGDDWQKFANLRLLFAFMHAHPGRKLLFMGGEFGQWNEWNSGTSLDWHLVQPGSRHSAMQQWVADLNHLHRSEPALHTTDADLHGFEWVDSVDAEQSTLSWLRRDKASGNIVLAVFNFTPVPRHNHRVGVPTGGRWKELLNSDAREYGGSGQGNMGGIEASPIGWNSQTHSLNITLPPLGAVFFKGPQLT